MVFPYEKNLSRLFAEQFEFPPQGILTAIQRDVNGIARVDYIAAIRCCISEQNSVKVIACFWPSIRGLSAVYC